MADDLEDYSLPWFAVYVKSRHEKNVKLILEGKGYETFLPTYVNVHDNRQKFDLPLFPGYVFCRLNALMPLPILSTPGVFSIVSNGCVPVPVRDREIEGVRRLLATRVEPCRWPYVAPGQNVHVHSGPLRGVEGVVVDDRHGTWLVISVHLLQRSIAAKIERDCIRGPDQWAAAQSTYCVL